MVKSLRGRFIIFSVLMVSDIFIILGLLVYFAPTSTLSAQKLISTFLLCTTIVLAGSQLPSKVAIESVKQTWQKQLDFTADAFYELRTPITVIQTNLELVMDSPEETVAVK